MKIMLIIIVVQLPDQFFEHCSSLFSYHLFFFDTFVPTRESWFYFVELCYTFKII